MLLILIIHFFAFVYNSIPRSITIEDIYTMKTTWCTSILQTFRLSLLQLHIAARWFCQCHNIKIINKINKKALRIRKYLKNQNVTWLMIRMMMGLKCVLCWSYLLMKKTTLCLDWKLYIKTPANIQKVSSIDLA